MFKLYGGVQIKFMAFVAAVCLISIVESGPFVTKNSTVPHTHTHSLRRPHTVPNKLRNNALRDTVEEHPNNPVETLYRLLSLRSNRRAVHSKSIASRNILRRLLEIKAQEEDSYTDTSLMDLADEQYDQYDDNGGGNSDSDTSEELSDVHIPSKNATSESSSWVSDNRVNGLDTDFDAGTNTWRYEENPDADSWWN